MISENKKVLFIINKFSGTGYSHALEGRIIAACKKLNLECVIEFTSGRGHATVLAKAAAKNDGYQSIFAVGGDGTVNEVAQGLVHGSIPMGILPKGSGNGLARHLGISTNLTKALQLIGSNEVIAMDTFHVNEHLSVNVSGIGFDGHIAGLFGKNGKRGLVNYGKLVLKEFRHYKQFPLELTMDGKRFSKEAFIVAFANSSQFGNNARVAPQASVCDQLIDVCIVKKVPASKAVGFAHKMFTGRINRSAYVEILQAKKIEIYFPQKMAFHIDGEAVPSAADFRIELFPSSLKMLVPIGQSKKV